VDCFREFPGAPGAASELAEDLPCFELRVRALAGRAEPCVSAVGLFLWFRLVLPLVRDLRPGAALIALVREGDQAGFLQLIEHAPDPLGPFIVNGAGQRAGDPQDVSVRGRDDLQVHPVLFVLARVERPVRGDPVDRDQRAVEDDIGVTCPLRVSHRLPELRRPRREQLHCLVHVPPGRGPADPEPGRELGERLALAQVRQYEQGLLAGAQLPPPRPDRLQVPADDPGRVVQRPGRQRQRGTVKQHKEAPGRGEGEFWSTSSLTGGFLMPGGDTPHLHQTVTNPLQAGWNQLTDVIAQYGLIGLPAISRRQPSSLRRVPSSPGGNAVFVRGR
jgi:hypothetical protein